MVCRDIDHGTLVLYPKHLEDERLVPKIVQLENTQPNQQGNNLSLL
jgi:hypothetical protein